MENQKRHVAESPAESRDPATGEVWASFPSFDHAEVQEALGATRGASQAWKKKSIRERASILRRFRHLVIDRRDSVARTISGETGKPTAEALFEIFGAAEFARYYAKIAPRVLANRNHKSSNLAIWRKRIRTEMSPYGVIGVITPWNYPLLLAAGIVIPALVAGNGVVLKPSENTPSSAEVLRDLLVEAGLPPQVLTLVHGAGATGAALVESGVDKIFFIGSEAAGRKVAASAASRMIPYVLELGGSDPAIVLEDAHLETAAAGISWGRFTNAGQTCVAPKRVFVIDSVYEEFIGHLSRAVERLDVGARGDIGPLIRPVQKRLIEEQLADALGKGARIVARATSGEQQADSFFPPTVLVDVRPGMRVLDEETFGPLLPVIPVRDENEAIERANATTFGLSASVWSRDLGRARRLAHRIEAGTVTINDSVVVALVADMPYGGLKSSGSGRSHGREGLLECVQTRSIVEDPFARFRETYWHEYTSDVRDGFDAFLVFAHGKGLVRRVLAGLRAVWLLYVRR